MNCVKVFNRISYANDPLLTLTRLEMHLESKNTTEKERYARRFFFFLQLQVFTLRSNDKKAPEKNVRLSKTVSTGQNRLHLRRIILN